MIQFFVSNAMHCHQLHEASRCHDKSDAMIDRRTSYEEPTVDLVGEASTSGHATNEWNKKDY